MPIYEYHCPECKKDLEIIQKFSDKPLKRCPECGGKIKKQMSLSGFHLKGGGWYKDGYSSPSKPSSEASTTVAEKKAPPCGEKAAATCEKKEKCSS